MRLIPPLAAICAAASLTAAETGAAHDDVIVVTAQRLPEAAGQTLQPVDLIDEATRRDGGYPIEPIEPVAELPGVWLQESGAISGLGSLRLRGAPGYGTLVVFDGVPLHDPAGPQSDPNLRILNPAGFAATEVVRGPQSGLYGSRAIGGVVHFRPLVASAEHQALLRLQGGSFETAAGLAQASGPIGGSSGYALGLSDARSEGITNRSSGANGEAHDHEEDALERTGVYARLEHRPLEHLSVFAAVDALRAETEYDSFSDPESEAPVTEYGSYRLHAGARLTDPGGRFSAAADVAWTLLDRETPEEPFGSNDWQGRELFASAHAGWRPLPLLGLSGGIDLRQEQAEITGAGATSLDEDARHLGLWLRCELTQERWGIAGTLRHEDHSEEGDATTWQLNAAVTAIPDRVQLHALVGSTFRAPSLYETFSQDVFDLSFYGLGIVGPIGNPDLEPETGLGFAIGHRSRLAKRVVLSNTVFSTRLEDRIGWDEASGYVNIEQKERIDGVESELLIEHSEEMPLDLRITYTWQRFDHAGDLALRLPENLLRSAFTWHAPRDVRLQIAITAVDQRSDAFDARLEPYTLVDLVVGWRVDPRWELFLRGENLTDEDYELTDGYATTGIGWYLGGAGRF